MGGSIVPSATRAFRARPDACYVYLEAFEPEAPRTRSRPRSPFIAARPRFSRRRQTCRKRHSETQAKVQPIKIEVSLAALEPGLYTCQQERYRRAVAEGGVLGDGHSHVAVTAAGRRGVSGQPQPPNSAALCLRLSSSGSSREFRGFIAPETRRLCRTHPGSTIPGSLTEDSDVLFAMRAGRG